MNYTPPYWNYTTNMGMTGVISTVTTNISYAFPLVDIAILLIMLYYTSTTNYGRKKYIPLFFLAWVFSVAQAYYGLIGLDFAVLLFIIYVIVTYLVMAFGD
jgi:hypothetical protein